MNLVEGMSCVVKPAVKRVRKVPGYWNWPELIELAQKCLLTKQEEHLRFGGAYYAVAYPNYGRTPESQPDGYRTLHEQVRIALFTLHFTFEVNKEEMIVRDPEAIKAADVSRKRKSRF